MRSTCTIALLIGIALCLRSAEVPASADPSIELVCLLKDKPLRIKVRFQDEAALTMTRWDQFISAWFDFLDRDGDGKLNETELRRAPTPGQLAEQWQAGMYPRLGIGGAVFADADANRDGSISRDELDRYYRLGGAGPVLVSQVKHRDHHTRALNSVLFSRLDRTGDGRLSRSELSQAAESLFLLDSNDDEILTIDEILADARTQPTEQLATPVPHFVLGPSASLLAAQRELLSQGLAKRDPLERDKLINAGPDLEIVLHIAKKSETNTLDILPRNEAWKLDSQSVPPSTYSSGTRIVARTAPGQPSLATSIRQYYRQQFQTADRKLCGRLSKPELTAPSLLSLRDIFDLADRDGDGELTEKELLQCVDLYLQSLSAHVALTISNDDAGLFELLDTNGDGWLSLRELRATPERLLRFARKADSFSRDDIPNRIELVFSLGPPDLNARHTGDPNPLLNAPGWFKLMDRNGDGDISPREFIGSRADFQKLDLNGDGLISVSEALQARIPQRP